MSFDVNILSVFSSVYVSFCVCVCFCIHYPARCNPLFGMMMRDNHTQRLFFQNDIIFLVPLPFILLPVFCCCFVIVRKFIFFLILCRIFVITIIPGHLIHLLNHKYCKKNNSISKFEDEFCVFCFASRPFIYPGMRYYLTGINWAYFWNVIFNLFLVATTTTNDHGVDTTIVIIK